MAERSANRARSAPPGVPSAETAGGRATDAGPVLIRSKLQPPRLPSRHVARPRLHGLLEQGRECRLTLVCAPPGYGKTGLLAEWRASQAAECPLAWVSLDRADSDPVRFWAHTLAAIAGALPELGATPLLPLELQLYPGNLLDVVLPRLADTLHEANAELVVVLDDYQLVDSPLCDTALDFFVRHAPDSVQLVVASRIAPRLPLGRLRANGELAEVGACELRLTEEEAARVLAAEVPGRLSPAQARRLVERTEGWPAGVHLASLLLERAPDPGAAAETLSGASDYFFDYLEGDLLAGLPEEMRVFLRRTSILERLSASLCDAVLQSKESARLLHECEQANLFLVPLGDARGWSRYHHLFADVLRRSLVQEEAEILPMLHSRASVWLEERGFVEQAIDHAIEARDVARASDLITIHLRSFVRSGRLVTLRRWLDALTWKEASSDPQLAVARALVLAFVNEPPERVEKWLQVALRARAPGALANGMPSLEFGVALVRALFLLDDVGAASRAGRLVAGLAEEDNEWRLEALLGRGHSLYVAGHAGEARSVLEQAMRERRSDTPQTMATIVAYLAMIELDRGEVDAGEALARRSLTILEERGLGDLMPASSGRLALGVALGARGALADAEAEIRLGAELRENRGATVMHAHALVLLARARHAMGNVAAATATLEEARLEVESLRDAGIVRALLEDSERRLRVNARPLVTTGDELSERESVVLRLLAAGRTKPEIANELYITYNTVKTHTRTIYRKLGVSRRSDAVERARALGLM
jgi:LuxR family transcriptional regulator, maltose regulon positive regulatory protein